MGTRRLALLTVLPLLLSARATWAQATPQPRLENGSFEQMLNGMPASWQPQVSPSATVRWEPKGGVGDSACVSVEVAAPSAEDAVTLTQDLTLEPFATYIVRGSIRGEGVRQADGARGEAAGPSIVTSMWQSDTLHCQPPVSTLGTLDWTPFALDVATTRDGLLSISLRFGAGGMLGRVWFDDISVEPNPDTERFEGKHLVLNLYKDEVEMATRAGVEQAVRNTDTLCEAYAELTGDPLPDDLRLTAWAPRLWDIGALGWSSDPVEWVVIPEVLKQNWAVEGFCPEVLLHEYAHVFDRDRWSFEMHFSELFMYYACETRDMGIAEDSGFRRGAAVRDRWEIRGAEGVPNVCAIVRKCITLRDQFGWEPFRKTYRWFQSLDRVPIPGACLATYPEGKPGAIRREVWKGLRGDKVADLTGSPRYAGAPDVDDTLPSLECAQPPFAGYGQRLRGYLLPPETGSYTFWISSDDSSELWLSTDEEPASKRKIAFLEGYCDPRAALAPSQQSEPIALEQGKRYYIEVLHRDSDGGSHVSVAWSPRAEDRISPETMARLGTRWGKMQLYFDKLTEYSGTDAWSVFTPEEREIARWAFTPRPEPTLAPADAPADTATLGLGDAAWESAEVGWEQPTRDSVPGDMPLRSAEGVHFHGLYAHAASRYAYRLGGKWATLETLYHLQQGHDGSTVFVIRGDGKELFRSDLVRDAAERTARIDVTSIDRLELVTEDGGNGMGADWGVWSEPELRR
jgi:hypothetical protein